MKKVSEIITPENGLFAVLKSEHSQTYNDLFTFTTGVYIGYVEPEELDFALLNNCGERYATPLIIHHSMSKAVNYIVNKYADNWLRVKKTLTADYDALKPYSVESVTTGVKSATNDTSSESTDKTGVNTFDSDTPVDKTVDTNENTVNINQNENTETRVVHYGNNGNMQFATLIANELEIRKTSFISLVVNDVQSQITLDIY